MRVEMKAQFVHSMGVPHTSSSFFTRHFSTDTASIIKAEMAAAQYRGLGVDIALDYRQIKWLKAIPRHQNTGNRHRPELQERQEMA